MSARPHFLRLLRLFAANLCCLGLSLAADPRIGDVTPVLPSEKLQRALDGTFNFPPPPAAYAPPDTTPDTRGFAADRLFSVPPAGTHPRILFGPADLPRLRSHYTANEAGVGTLAALRAQLAKGIGTPGTWEAGCYAALAAGDLDAFRAAYKESPEDDNPPGSGFRTNISGRAFATRWGPRNPLLVALEVKALVALLDDDATAGREVATALTTYAAYLSPKVDAANARPRAEFHWGSTRYLVPNEVAYAYDWSWPWMTPSQRDSLRSLIVRATVGKYTVGMDLPPHWRNWNHLGMTESYAACLFAIEGEPGDDPRGLARIFEVYRDYLSYGISPLGSGKEGIGYQTLGIGHLSSPMLAFANRGKNLFTHPHWRRHTESWLVQSMMPFGGAWQADGDLGNFSPHLSMLGLQKYFYPDSPGIDFVLRNHPNIREKNWAAITADANEAQWLTPVLPNPVADVPALRTAAQHEAAALVGGGLTFHDPARGTLYTRTGWAADDLLLFFTCRTDTTYPTHDHADRGSFTLASHGRAWAADGYRDTESKFHNVVTIDGRGQGYFAAPGRWLSSTDTTAVTTAVVDTKYNWDWQWAKSMYGESAASLEARNQAWGVPHAARLQARFPVSTWEIDPLPSVTDYYTGYATREKGDPRMWDDEDGWQPRIPWYPVQKAFRTVTLARGPHPYVLIIDDIRKDDAERLYEWRMNLPPDVAAVSINAADILLGDRTTARKPADNRFGFQGNTDLAPAKGDRLLLVRTLDIGVPDLPTLQPIPTVSTIEYKKTADEHQFTGRSMGMGTQVVIGSRSIEPNFVVLLYPHRQGDPLPATNWNADRTRLTVSFPAHTDTYAVTTTPEGRRVFTLSAK